MKRRFSGVWAANPPVKKSKKDEPVDADSEDEGLPDVFK